MNCLTQHSVSNRSAAHVAVKEMETNMVLSSEEQLEVVRLYEGDDMTTKGIASRFGVSDTTVRNVLRSHGITPHRGSKAILPEAEDRMISLYESGLNVHDVAKGCGVVPSTVLKVLRRRGIERRANVKRKVLSDEQRLELARKYADGSTFSDLESEYKVSCSVVKSCLDEFNVEHRTSGRAGSIEYMDTLGQTWMFKSTWEHLYAQWLDKGGFRWSYEPRSFDLSERRCYTPDFSVVVDGSVEYHEVKGWLNEKAEDRMREFVSMYPSETLVLVGPSDMARLGLVEEWYQRHSMADVVDAFKASLVAKEER